MITNYMIFFPYNIDMILAKRPHPNYLGCQSKSKALGVFGSFLGIRCCRAFHMSARERCPRSMRSMRSMWEDCESINVLLKPRGVLDSVYVRILGL